MAGPRSEARRYAVLALYQWQLSGQSPAEIARHFFDDPSWMEAIAEGMTEAVTEERGRPASAPSVGDRSSVEVQGTADPRDRASPAAPKQVRRYDAQLFDQLLRGATDHADEIDQALTPVVDRSLRSIDPVERAILGIGAFELLHNRELPIGVILNEAVELAKVFGAEQGHKYINGVLDRLARQVRPDEAAARRGRPAPV